jgi:NAD(P)H-dependent flavin oxidoreductase YrpB (nitropropane dioxygenase family)
MVERSRSFAAGGIYDGADIHAALNLGASAVQMGTRFVATDECDADYAFKHAYVEAVEDQIGIIKSPVGMPGRAIRNDFITDSEEGKRPAFRCAWKCLSTCKADDAKYCISIALNNARQGNIEAGLRLRRSQCSSRDGHCSCGVTHRGIERILSGRRRRGIGCRPLGIPGGQSAGAAKTA